MEEIIYNSLIFIPDAVAFIPLLGVVYLVGMYIFWWESDLVKKNRNSVFDQWIFTTLVMIAWGRITYLITNWNLYSVWNWFYLPYERYQDQVYLFRAMPWRLFMVWDGGFLFIPMFVIYMLAGFLFTVVIKRWRWSEMMGGVLYTANFLFGSTLLLTGLYVGISAITFNGLILLLFSLLIQIIIHSIKWFYKVKPDSYVRMARVLTFSYLVADFAFISWIFLGNSGEQLLPIERYHIYALFPLAVLFAAVYVWDLRRGPVVEPLTDKRIPQPRRIYLNQAIRVDK